MHSITKNDLNLVFNHGSPALIAATVGPHAGTPLHGAGAVWHSFAQELVLVAAEALCELRDHRVAPCDNGLSAQVFLESIQLNPAYGLSRLLAVSQPVRSRLTMLLESLPGIKGGSILSTLEGSHTLLTEHYAYVTMLLTPALMHFARIEQGAT